MNNWSTLTRTAAIFITILLLTACGGGGGEGSGTGGAGTGGTGESGGDTGGTSYGAATLSWLPPTENTDGSALTDLAGYKIYYGTEVDNYTTVVTIDNPGMATYVIDNLPTGNTYYFVITAIDSTGQESEFSAIGSKNIPT